MDHTPPGPASTGFSGSRDTTDSHRIVQPVGVTPFDDYLLVGALGHGGMAEVHLALHEGPGGFRRLVVIKRLLPHLSGDPGVVRMFLDEARLAARLDHPNIVRVEKVGEAEGRHFIAMEHLDGQPLNRLFRDAARVGRPLPIPIVAHVIAEALDALGYAHEARDYDGRPLSVVHRDVSPQNLFVTHQGITKLLDFGIAKATTQEGETRAGFIKGKFGYLSPEQARGHAVDARSDLFSMGIVLWEGLANRRLFHGTTDAETLEQNLVGSVPDVRELAPEVPPKLAELVARALSRDPAERPATAAEMKRVVERFAVSTLTSSSRDQLCEHLRRRFGGERERQQDLIRRCVEQVDRARSTVPPPLPTSTRGTRAASDPGPGEPATSVTEVLESFTAAFEAPAVPAAARPRARRIAAAAVGGVALAAVGAALAFGRVEERGPAAGGAADALAAAPAAAPPVAAPAAAPPGRLTLTTSPPARVFLEGRPLGTSPLREVELPAGDHELVLESVEGDLRTRIDVTIPPGDRAVLRVDLR